MKPHWSCGRGRARRAAPRSRRACRWLPWCTCSMPRSRARTLTIAERRAEMIAQRTPACLQQLDAVAVAHVEDLERFALRRRVQAAVGQHAVDVEDHQAQPGGALLGREAGSAAASHQPRARQVVHVQRADQLAVRRPPATGCAACGRCISAASAASCCGADRERIARHHRRRCREAVKSPTRSIRRRRSPSVKTPIEAAAGIEHRGHAHLLLRDFVQRVEQGGVAAHDRHRVAGAHDVGHAQQQLRPSAPPGCERAKSSAPKPRASRQATASASPSASIAVVEDVGARFSGQASLATRQSRCTSAYLASVELGLPVIAISGVPSRLIERHDRQQFVALAGVRHGDEDVVAR